MEDTEKKDEINNEQDQEMKDKPDNEKEKKDNNNQEDKKEVKVYTEEQYNEVVKERDNLQKEVNDLMAQVNDLKKNQAPEKTEKEIELEERERKNFLKEVRLTLRENNLEKFADIISVSNEDELKEKIDMLNQIMQSIKINDSYKPQDFNNQNKSKDKLSHWKSVFGINK